MPHTWTFVRFESGSEDRMGDALGPFDYVQLTYSSLTVQRPDGADQPETIAVFIGGYWETSDGAKWSDVVFWSDFFNPPQE